MLPTDRTEGARRPLGDATTLPAEAFRAPEIYADECERIFAGGWLCAGRLEQVPNRGDYRALDLLDDRLVMVRGDDDVVRVLSRICRHRGAELVSGTGTTRSLSCPYHAWTYRLDGRLLGAPHMDGATSFDRAHCRLPEIRSEVWEGFVFVNLDGQADALAPQLAGLSALLAPYRMADMVAVETATFPSPFNWKVLVDNFMEAYHHIATHRDTLEPIFPAALSHTPDNDGPWSALFMPGREGGPEPAMPASPLPLVGPLDDAQQEQLVAAVVYPFHLFAPGAHALTWYQLFPESVDRFTLQVYSCFPREVVDDPDLREAARGFQELTKVIHLQDIGACEATWSGLGARSYDTGWLSPLEKPIWQFNQWWLERMIDAG